MIQIIKEKKKPSFGQNFADAVSGLTQAGAQYFGEQQQKKGMEEAATKMGLDPAILKLPPQAQAEYFKNTFSKKKEPEDFTAENEAIKKNFGVDLSGIKDPNMRRNLVESVQKSNEFKKEVTRKKQEKLEPIQGGLDTLQRMKDLRKKGNLGVTSGFTGMFSEDTRRDRGEYSQLGKSLIQLSTSIPIRNKAEFETLAEKLYDPSITDAEAEGILDGMERILSRSAQSLSDNEGEEKESPPKKKKSLTSFIR